MELLFDGIGSASQDITQIKPCTYVANGIRSCLRPLMFCSLSVVSHFHLKAILFEYISNRPRIMHEILLHPLLANFASRIIETGGGRTRNTINF